MGSATQHDDGGAAVIRAAAVTAVDVTAVESWEVPAEAALMVRHTEAAVVAAEAASEVLAMAQVWKWWQGRRR